MNIRCKIFEVAVWIPLDANRYETIGKKMCTIRAFGAVE